MADDQAVVSGEGMNEAGWVVGGVSGSPGVQPELEPLEVASGMIFGGRRSPAAPRSELPVTVRPQSVRETLERLLLPALSRTQCVVAFSGGRDSSAMLAVATHVARKHGLQDPVPITFRFAAHPRTWETQWQELTIRHLGLSDWDRVELEDELDAVGDLAGRTLLRHGSYWPPNSHVSIPMLARAAGGALVTGDGGDEVFSPWGHRRLRAILGGRALPRREDLKYVALLLLPRRLRVAAWVTRRQPRLRWLTPEALREVQRLFAVRRAAAPPNWQTTLTEFLESRYVELAFGIGDLLARDAEVLAVSPFSDPRFMEAAVHSAPRDGFPSRTAALEAHFGDLLPPEALRRSTKASFTEVLIGPATRAFVAGWDGSGVDEALVDPVAVGREWSKPRPDFRSLTLLQSAWLNQSRPG